MSVLQCPSFCVTLTEVGEDFVPFQLRLSYLVRERAQLLLVVGAHRPQPLLTGLQLINELLFDWDLTDDVSEHRIQLLFAWQTDALYRITLQSLQKCLNANDITKGQIHTRTRRYCLNSYFSGETGSASCLVGSLPPTVPKDDLLG